MGSVETRESRRDAAIAALPLVSVAITRCTHTRCWRWCALFCLRQCASLSHPPLLFFKEEEDDNKRRRRGGGGWKFMKKRRGDTHTKKKLTERETPERASTFPPLFPFNLGSGASALVARTCLMYRPIPLCQLDRPLSLLLPTHTPTLSVCSSERVPLSTLSRRALEERSPRSRLSPTTSKRITY